MDRRALTIVYCIGFILTFMIRLPYWWRARTHRIVVDRKSARDRSLLALLSAAVLGGMDGGGELRGRPLGVVASPRRP